MMECQLCQLILNSDPRTIGTIGLVCDMIGAVLVAIEVVRIYRGGITGTAEMTWNDLGKPTLPFLKFESRKRMIMGVGLFFLLIGFSFQIVAIWMK